MPDSSKVSQNLEVIRQAQRGSDVFGVLEKIAWIYSTIQPAASPEQNWFSAQETLANWQINIPKKNDLGYEKVPAKLPDAVTTHLNKIAYQLYDVKYREIDEEERKAGRNPNWQEIIARINPDEKWFKALYVLAHQIIYGYTYD
ncbi:hypothetical protein FJZ19_03185 [Candidatus Pacearchaeota archaeon]|nr:hypothetical protein [Candidatus Pacearchaeota archaeon]